MNKKKARRSTWLYVIGKFLLTLYSFVAYRIKVVGRENVPEEGPVLLCSNHTAGFDPILLSAILKRQVCYMSKEELFENRFLAWIFRQVGMFPVKRGSGGAEALDRACELLEENAIVGVFIEGTRSKTGQPQRPKTGAALVRYRTGATVVPVSIVAEDGRRLKAFKKRTIVRFGPPIPEERLAIPEGSSMYLRRASRAIMDEIVGLRKKTLDELGVPDPFEEPEKTPSESGEESL